MNERQMEIVNKFAITLEWLRNGALKGQVLDADGVTVIYNWFTEFGISQKTVNFDLTNEETNVAAKILEVKRHIEDSLLGDSMTRIHALCSPEFWEALVSSPLGDQTPFKYYQGVNNQRDDLRKGWEHQGVVLGGVPGPGRGRRGFHPQVCAGQRGKVLPRGHAEHLPHLCGACGLSSKR